MKKVWLLLFSLFFSFILIDSVEAASASINASSSKSTVIVGDTVTVTVKISSSSNLGAWNFDVDYSSNLTFVSSSFGGLYIADAAQTATTKSKSYTFTFRAKSSGTGKVSISNARVIDFDTEKNMSVSKGSTSFKIMTQSELESTYSKNNNLSSLEVEGHNLSPIFDKDTLEYSLELEYGTESINIKATKEDSSASVDGTGEISLSEGLNVLKVIVTAENGSTKTYIINATVKELDPINITVDGEEYSVVREKEFLPNVGSTYQDTVIKIDDKDVPAYYNSITDFTLVGLKNKAGDISLYLYKDGTYELYEEYNFNQLAIYLLDMDESLLPSGYTKNNIKIGDKEVVAYTKEGLEYPIIYGLNIATGEKNLYKYDAKENTIQRVENTNSNKEDLYFNIILGSLGFTAVSYLFFITLLSKKNKQQKNFLEKTMCMNISDIQTDKDLSDALYKNEGNLSKKEIKKNKKETKKKIKKDKKEAKKNKNDDEMASL